MGRIMALDYGSKRCGLAVTDELQLIASGLTTVDTTELLKFLAGYFSKEKVDTLVIGQPKRLHNQLSKLEDEIVGFIKEFKSSFPNINIERFDERFTSKMAFQSMLESGLKKKDRRNKALLDEVSATIILQGFLTSSK